MPEYLAPGVYVEEISTGAKPIEGVSTSVAGFVGMTERGPQDVQYITSWLAYQRWYGGHLGVDKSFMSYAVQGFFDNGGQRCFVARVVSRGGVGGAGEAGPPAQFLAGNLLLRSYGRGVWGNRIFVRITEATKAKQLVKRAVDEKWVRVQIAYYSVDPPKPLVDFTDSTKAQDPNRRTPDAFEDYDNLSIDLRAPNSLVTIINQASKLIRATLQGIPPMQDPPTSDQFAELQGGTDGQPLTLADYQGIPGPIETGSDTDVDLFGQGTGLTAMDTVDEVSLLLAPDQANDENLTGEIVKRCETLKDRFAVLSTPFTFPATGKPSFDTTYGAQYYPWIKIYDPFTRDDVLVPPAGHVAGIMARTDLDTGVHKAPANAVVNGAKDLQRTVTKSDQALLNPVGINCIRDFRSDGRGLRLWGARTMSSDPEWKYVNVRRLFLFIEESIDEGTQWVVFEPNSPSTWARVQRTITSFLTTVWRNGALMGVTQAEAFFVKCDRTTMTQDDIDNGRLICYIGIAPVKPAEFVIFRIGQKTADAQG